MQERRPCSPSPSTVPQYEGRATRIVTPTKKAADVAARELGVPAESVAKLLHAHGWRWNADGVWTRLAVGEPDPDTGGAVRRGAGVGATGARRASRGRRGRDARPGQRHRAPHRRGRGRGHGRPRRGPGPAPGRGTWRGARHGRSTDPGSGGAVFDMDSVHRFTDPAYADLTLQLRAGARPGAPVRPAARARASSDCTAASTTPTRTSPPRPPPRSGSDGAARSPRPSRPTTRLGPSTTAIRSAARRTRRGRRHHHRAPGTTGCPSGSGDVITTRKNDSTLGVANRQTWTVQQHRRRRHRLGGRRAPAGPSTGGRLPCPAPTSAEHVHLAYAATAYGVQGVTTTTGPHPAVGGVGRVRRVRRHDPRPRRRTCCTSSPRTSTKRASSSSTRSSRDRADRGLQAATAGAHVAVAGLAADGPVKVVNDERARLARGHRHAEREAARWEHAAALLGHPIPDPRARGSLRPRRPLPSRSSPHGGP